MKSFIGGVKFDLVGDRVVVRKVWSKIVWMFFMMIVVVGRLVRIMSSLED
jgi:hypothetical protein